MSNYELSEKLNWKVKSKNKLYSSGRSILDSFGYFCTMENVQFPFKVLFCFEDEAQLIVEIKRIDIQSEDKSLVYKWLVIQKQNEKQNENEFFG